MAFPVVPVVRPGVLSGLSNGKLPDSALVDTPGQAGGYTVRLVAPAARAWRALCAAALAAGHTLKPSGLYDSYRPYTVQEKVFLARFSTTNTGTGITRTWQGKTWWLKPGVALAAVPGTSNHGWGLAVDTGEERDGDTGAESIDTATLNWLLANELRFGFSHEVQSEPWHIRYTAGDAIPAAVLAYEEADEMTPEEHAYLLGAAWRLHGLAHGEPLPADKSNPLPGESLWIVEQIKAMAAGLEELKAAVAKLASGGVDKATLVEAAFEGAQRAEQE